MTTAGEFRRILLIRRKALGDALVTVPAILEVVQAWPNANIDLVIDRSFADLLADLLPEVRVVSWPPGPGKSWLRSLRQGRYDLVIDWLGNPRTAMWTALTGAPVRVGYDLPRRSWAYNVKVPRNRDQALNLRSFAGEAFLDPLRCLGLTPAPWRDSVLSAQQETEGNGAGVRDALVGWSGQWLARQGVPVVVVMSATREAKKWPALAVVDLLGEMPPLGANPILVTGPGDEWLESALPPELRQRVLAPETNLPELAFLLRQAPLFVGTDCGPRHLAAALGLRTLTVFGPTDPAGWNPPSPRHVSIQHVVECAPCHWDECPVAGHPCLNELDSGTVLAQVGRMLAIMGEDK